MEEEIFGMDSAYKEALSRPNTNMLISTNLVVERVNRISELEKCCNRSQSFFADTQKYKQYCN